MVLSSRWCGQWVLLLCTLILSHILDAASETCPNDCSGNGACPQANLVCQCEETYDGAPDCSLRTCPKGIAWADYATEIDVAHGYAECSNRGRCVRETGVCQCDEGFEGDACQRLSCPNRCSGHGACKPLSYAAAQKDPGLGIVHQYGSNWDSDKIYGCICDRGYGGYDCSLRLCPSGDDPLTTGQANHRMELFCQATSGYLMLSFRKETTEHINADDTAQLLMKKLNALPTLHGVSVSINAPNGQLCSAQGTTSFIEFLQDFGDLPLLVGTSKLVNGASQAEPQLRIREVVKGTKEDEPCSRRGKCDYQTGVCRCFDNFDTSDGYGKIGQRGDCGFATSNFVTCPGSPPCSGRGYCPEGPSHVCVCPVGWHGGDCSLRSCPVGKAWFDLPVAENHAHNYAECSNMGLCNRDTGECQCSPNFEGGACERLKCPGTPACSGHGQCLTMELLAQAAQVNGVTAGFTYGSTPNTPQTWDFDKVQGCKCDPGWEGHDCSLRSCPMGDDPLTDGQVDEIQQITCTGTEGSFMLSFRDHRTGFMPFDASALYVQTQLELLPSIGKVTVTFSPTRGTACTADGSNVITIHFRTVHGPLPSILALASPPGDLELSIIQLQEGTKEMAPCSNRGICNHENGRCTCFVGFAGSDGRGGLGNYGDCGYKDPFWREDRDI